MRELARNRFRALCHAVVVSTTRSYDAVKMTVLNRAHMIRTNASLPEINVHSLRSRPAIAALAAEMASRAAVVESATAFLTEILPGIVEVAHGDFAAVAIIEAGRWSTIANAGQRQSLPIDLLSDVLDAELLSSAGGWVCAPLAWRNIREVLLVHTNSKSPATASEVIEALAPVLAANLYAIRTASRQVKRIERLESILQIAQDWNQTHEMEPLLVQMAQAATRFLEGDRASIFLWDKSNRTLVGRPALGIEGGELRIPDDRGVVGSVVQTGQPRRVTSSDGKEISRQVDSEHGYQTRNLICVPLRGRRGELFGAFEVLNRKEGVFSEEDESALVELASHAAVALENTQEWQQLLSTHRQIVNLAAEDVKLIGQSAPIEALRSTIRRVANTELAVLLLGENGTGKEVLSQSIHYLSPRRNQPFIAVNCAAITETLLESELFGHEKGAFTDAHEARAGKFELASGGTLFLDEIGDLSRGGQAKLLRVLEEKIVVRVGGSRPIHTDARVIAATNQNLAEMVREKKFREDLYFRLNVVTLELPPLRDRGDDILLLAEHFLAEFSRKARRRPPKLSAAARKRLLQHAWPGNVRELRNLMERLAYLSQDDKIEADELAFILSPGASAADVFNYDLPLAEATDRFQTEYIKKAIDRARGNMSDAAGLLGLHRSNLYRKMRQLGMDAAE